MLIIQRDLHSFCMSSYDAIGCFFNPLDKLGTES